ncbi:SurA N-terminal domain-containing protein [Candidatus Babeliales bacterium]|nr:SurA N-terminal domain-containing protein [Candidatus Babeliales bacterium]
MNKFLRQELKNWNFLLWFVLIAIGVNSVMHLFQSSRETIVATINGSKITAHELQRGVVQEKSMRDMLAQYLGQKFNAPVEPEAVLKKMVQHEVVGYHAYQTGARIGDDAVAQHLFNMLPAFVTQKDGTVNSNAYTEYVRSQGFTVSEFEKMEETRLLQSFLHNALYTSVVMPDWFLQAEWNKRFDQKKYSVGTISYDSIKKQIDTSELSDDKLRSYFEGRQEVYRIPENRTIQYAEISFKDYADRSDFSEEEVKSFYERYKKRYFSTAPDASISEIFISSEGNENASKEIQDVYNKVKSDSSLFIDFAQKHARDDESAKKSGLIKSVKKGEVSENIRRTALRIKKEGDLSDIVTLHNGYAILKLEKKSEPVVRSLHDVRKDVVSRLKSGQSSRQLVSQIRQIIRASKNEPTIIFDKMKELGASWKKATYARDEDQEGIEGKLAIAAFGRGLQEGSVHFVQGQSSVVAFKVEDISISEIPAFKKVRSNILNDYIREDVENQAKIKARSIQQQVLNGASLKDMDCLVKDTAFMNEKELENQLKSHDSYSSKMLLLKDKSQVLRHHNESGYYVIQLIDTKENDSAATFSEEKKKEFALHQEAYKEIWLGIFIAYLEKNATIVYNTQILQ